MPEPGPFHMRRAGAGKLRRRLSGLDLSLSIEDQRAGLARLLALTEIGMPEHELERVEVDGIEALRIRAGADGLEWIHIHGGGHSFGSPQTHRPLVARLSARLDRPGLVPRYRLAPEHPAPAAIEDVLRFVLGLGPTPRIISGDSAGGALALALTFALRELAAPLPVALVLLSPWTDLTLSGESIDRAPQLDPLFSRPGLELMAARYVGALDPRDPRVSPLWGDLSGLPPMLIQAGGAEALLDDSTRLAARAAAAGVSVELQVWPEQGHVFQATPMLPAAAEALQAIADWLNR